MTPLLSRMVLVWVLLVTAAGAVLAASPSYVGGVAEMPDGKPAMATEVWLVIEQYPKEPQATEGVTDERGQFRFDLPPGAQERGSHLHLVFVPREGALSPFAVHSKATHQLRLQLREAVDAEALLVDEAGKPVAGIPVTPDRLTAMPRGNLELTFDFALTFPAKLARRFGTKSDERGICRFKSMPRSARLRLTIGDERFAHPTVEETLQLNERTDNPQKITLLPAATISGRVVYAEGSSPAPGIQVGAQGTRRNLVWGNAFTDESGRYTIKQMRPGPMNVALGLTDELAEKVTAKAHEGVRLDAGQHLTDVNFELVPGAVIVGKVVASDTKEPIESADIAIYGPAHPKYGAWVQATRTKKDGTYLLRVPPGAQYLYYRGLPGFGKPGLPTHEFEIPNGETRTIDFEVPRK